MRAFAEAHPDQVTILDWPAYSSGHGDWFAPDGLHLTTDGAQGFAQMIGEAVEFAPLEPIEPPRARQPDRPRRPEPTGNPRVMALWRAVGRVMVSVLTPPLQLLGGLIGDPGGLRAQDL
jgi:hypothetical protein